MAALEDTLRSLKLSDKGKLKYDSQWLIDGNFSATLNECSSPPIVSTLPKTRTPLHCLTSISPSVKKQHRAGASPLQDAGTQGCHSIGSIKQFLLDINNEPTKHQYLSLADAGDASTLHPVFSLAGETFDGVDVLSEGDHWPSYLLNDTPPSFAEAGQGDTPHSKDEKNSINEDTRRHSPPIMSPQAALAEVAIKDYEDEYDRQATNVLESRRRLFENHARLLEQDAERKGLELQLEKDRASRKLLHYAEQQIIQGSEEVKKKQQKLREHHRQHGKMLESRMKEAEEEKQKQEEEFHKRNEECKQRLSAISTAQSGAHADEAQIDAVIASCQYPALLGDIQSNIRTLITQVVGRMDQEVATWNTSDLNEKQVIACEMMRDKVRNTLNILKKAVDNANKKGTTEEEQQKKQDAANAAATAASTAVSAATSVDISAGTGERLCITEDAFKSYIAIKEQHASVVKACEPLRDNKALKKYCFDLKKAINTPINTISSQSGAHLREKLTRLTAVLAGQHVEVGNHRVSAAENVVGIPFVKDLFAGKIVDAGSQQVASQHESAFTYAAVAVGVWADHEDVGQLLLAHFHKQCPYTVPYYPPKLPNQTNQEYYSCLGYRYEGDTIEEQDKFLSRMQGMIRLYAAILISPLPGRSQPSPHGVEHGWAWLSRSLNLDPWPDITANCIHIFLEVAGHTLWRAYGPQFLKLLQLLVSEYLPKIQAVTDKGSGGPVTRLQNYLEKCITTGNIQPPEGVLTPQFWSSR